MSDGIQQYMCNQCIQLCMRNQSFEKWSLVVSFVSRVVKNDIKVLKIVTK